MPDVPEKTSKYASLRSKRISIANELGEISRVEAAGLLGITPEALRYRETTGSIVPARRTSGGRIGGSGLAWYKREDIEKLKKEAEDLAEVKAKGVLRDPSVQLLKAFDLFRRGATLEECIRVLGWTPDKVRKAHAEWKTPLGAVTAPDPADEDKLHEDRIKRMEEAAQERRAVAAKRRAKLIKL